MFNIKAAVSRLDFAPRSKEMKVTDISTGHFVFSPVPGKQVAYYALQKAIEGAGYRIERAWIEARGNLINDRYLEASDTGQVFHLLGDDELVSLRRQAATGAAVTVSGPWTAADGAEVIEIRGSNSDDGS